MTRFAHRLSLAFAAASLIALVGCAHEGKSPSPQAVTATSTAPESTSPAARASVTSAVATLTPTQGNQVAGTVTFTRESNGVRVSADLTGLTPGDHGIHVHENGDCSSVDAMSAGGHFNPGAMTHGGPESAQHHAGDLGNITADSTGHARLDRVFDGISLDGDHSIVGRALVVHSGQDDFATQPSGNSGTRVACGVISAR
jgi:Cu-Zn family superoxide dismutase